MIRPVSPSTEYAQRLAERESDVRTHETLHRRVGNFRLLLASGIAILLWLTWSRHPVSAWWLIPVVATFIGTGIYHSMVLSRLAVAKRAARFYRLGIARIDDRWAGTGQDGMCFADPHHLYSSDLDVFGRGGLFEFLSTARTRMGEDTLARWLLSPATVAEIRERQEAISELREKLDLCEDLSVLGEDTGPSIRPESLLRWTEEPGRLQQRWLPSVAPFLSGLVLLGVWAWVTWHVSVILLVACSLAALIRFFVRREIEQTVCTTERQFENLDLLSGILRRLESEPFQASKLHKLSQELKSHHLEGSRAIARLKTIVNLIESRRNMMVRMLDIPLMYSVQVALAAERWRKNHASAVRRWLASIGEIEALISFATYSFEHPGDPFPNFVDGPACFDGTQIGHPLIPVSNCVRNDVKISGETRILLVSGSNMSGKSTLLRAVGICTVMAMAGAPVRATRVQLSPLQVGASIRRNDSLQEGVSGLYAEIKRLRAIVDLGSDACPLLYVLDELLQGTNSTDRRIGVHALVRVFLNRASIGLISTHDLALAEIPALESAVRNVHFQDSIEDGRMKFDYLLRDGVVTKSNGLELMRSVGLEV